MGMMVVVIVLALLIAGGFYFYQTKSTAPAEPAAVSQASAPEENDTLDTIQSDYSQIQQANIDSDMNGVDTELQ